MNAGVLQRQRIENTPELWERLGFTTADLIPPLSEQAVIGVQVPRLSWLPLGEIDFSLGVQAADWARDTLGVYLDPWQRLLLRMILARRPDGRWACRQFGLVISRQNGKSLVLLVRCLFGIIVLGEQNVVFSAHLGDTIRGIFELAKNLLENAPRKADIGDWHAYNSDGRERIEFTSGRALRFKTRTKSGGRGLTGEVLVLDEAQELRDEHMDALAPILGSKSMVGNPQILFSGSAGDFESTVFSRIRRRGMAGGADGLGFAEWSIDDAAYFAADAAERDRIVRDPQALAEANPTFNVVRADGTGGISEPYLNDELDLLSPAGFAREHLGVGTWPKDEGTDWVIPRARWNAQARPDAALPDGQLVLALSGAWGNRSTSIGAAVGSHGWLERMDRGTDWVVGEVVRLAGSRGTAAVMVDPGGPAAPLIPRLRQALAPLGVEVVEMSGREMATACGDLYDALTTEPATWTHRGQPEVTAALAGAKKKDLGAGLWLFDKAKSETEVSPLEAVAWARYGWVLHGDTDGFNIW